MAQPMGFGTLAKGATAFKRKNRWLFRIDGIADDGVRALPPSKAARPSLTFKEMEVQHLNETVFYPGRPEWKPIQLTLYDIIDEGNDKGSLVVEWIKKVYDAQSGNWQPACGTGNVQIPGSGFKKRCLLEMFDGCGNTCESWTFENAWPQVIEWGELDMSEAGIVTIDITLRYDRAYKIIGQQSLQ